MLSQARFSNPSPGDKGPRKHADSHGGPALSRTRLGPGDAARFGMLSQPKRRRGGSRPDRAAKAWHPAPGAAKADAVLSPAAGSVSLRALHTARAPVTAPDRA
jgi:hypothetical protein